MNKFLFLGILSLCYSLNIHSQFYSSENVYCYKYEYTSNDGIKSKSSSTYYYFVNFQNDMMGYTFEDDIKRIRKKLLENPTYYEDEARDNLASKYNRWKSDVGWCPIGVTWTAEIYKYNDKYSTSSKYTYRSYYKIGSYAYVNSWGQPQGSWGSPSWGSSCYSFTRDRSEMIIWSTDDPENRGYYKLVNISDLMPNTDFLY